MLASDAVHYYEELERDRPFSIVASLADMYAAFDRIRALAEAGARVVAGHDPLVAERFGRPADPPNVITMSPDARVRPGRRHPSIPVHCSPGQRTGTSVAPRRHPAGIAVHRCICTPRPHLRLCPGLPAGTFVRTSTGLWAEAAQALPAGADHTEIARWLEP